MSTIEQDLQSFTAFAQGHISSGAMAESLDELFDRWRQQIPSDELHAENVAAINAAIADFQNGDRGTPAGEHSRKLRREFGLDGR